MGMCTKGGIFQAKVDELLGDIEGVETYIDDILILGKDSFENYIEQLIIIFGRMCAAGLQVNVNKWIFGVKEITYLGYVILREGTKPEPKKVQGIMDLRQPSTTTEARALVGIVQYYRDITPRWSHVLDPLT